MAHVSKRTTKTGEARYDVEWRLPDGKVRTRTFARRKDADAFRATIEAERLRGVVVDPRGARTPLSNVATRWLAAGASKRTSTIERDRAIIENHVLPTLGDRAVGSITKADVQATVDAWTKTQAPSTVGRQYSCLRAILTYALDADLIARNPCRSIRLPQVTLVERPQLAPDELGRLASALGADHAVMMWLGAELGLRWAEAAGLTVDRLDLLGGQIVVDRQLTRHAVLAPTKSASSTRRLALSLDLVEDLAALLARRALTASDADVLLFSTPDGSPLDYTNWRRRISVPACERTGLARLRFHDLRSIATSALVAEGVDVKTAQKRLGHSSARVTLDIYARTTEGADRNAARLVAARLRSRDTRGMRRSGE